MLPCRGSVVAGKFRLERPLAQGGMGAVWVAFNQQLDVPVAIKFMAPALVGSPELVARFEHEAKAAAQLRTPYVVQIFEHGIDRNVPFIAMELLEGEDLSTRIHKKGRLSLQETSAIMGDVCKALRRAREQGLVHRDLKPANIFLCRHEDYEIAKVLDFGIAKSLLSNAVEDTKADTIIGSPHYMSPEQARHTTLDHRSDLWALGVIAYRCLTDRLPFFGGGMIDVLVRVCTDPAPAPSTLVKGLGPEVDQFFERALARDPDDRFQSARDFAEAFAKLAGLPAWQSGSMPAAPPSDPAVARISRDEMETVAVPMAAPTRQIEINSQVWASFVSGSSPPPATEAPLGDAALDEIPELDAAVVEEYVPRPKELEPTRRLRPHSPPAPGASDAVMVPASASAESAGMEALTFTPVEYPSTDVDAALALAKPTRAARGRAGIALSATLLTALLLGGLAAGAWLRSSEPQDNLAGQGAGTSGDGLAASVGTSRERAAGGPATDTPAADAFPAAAAITTATPAPGTNTTAAVTVALAPSGTAATAAPTATMATGSPSQAAPSRRPTATTSRSKGPGESSEVASGFLSKPKF